MNEFETRLEGRQANLEGVAAYINSRMDLGPFKRIEVRLSSQALCKLDSSRVQQRIISLLREHGHPQAAVSVRGADNRLEDALGAHLIRLIPLEQASHAPNSRLEPGWRSLLNRLMRRSSGSTHANAALERESMPPTVSQKDAVQVFEQAMSKAASTFPTENPVLRALVIVRLGPLHQVLHPLLHADQHGTSQHIRARLSKLGLNCATQVDMAYQFSPRTGSEGTVYLADSDIDVQLFACNDNQSADRGATLKPQMSEHSTVDAVTLLPNRASKLPADEVEVRIVGSTEYLFETPVNLGLHTLPLSIHRDWLQSMGFGQSHQDLLAGVSRNCPLTVLRVDQDAIHLRAPLRQGPEGAHSSLYHLWPTRHPLQVQQSVPGSCIRLSLNHPDGLQNFKTGKPTPALVIELISHAACAHEHGRLN